MKHDIKVGVKLSNFTSQYVSIDTEQIVPYDSVNATYITLTREQVIKLYNLINS